MAGIRARIVGVVVAYVALVALGQAILSLTPFELHPTVSTEGRQLDVLLELVWIIALVVQMRRQPSSGLWKLILLWVAVSQVWTLGYIPIEPVWLVELPGHLFGELWAAVFVHLIVAYPSGRLAHRRDRILVGIVYAVAIGFRFMALVVAPEPCWQICANPFRVLPSTELFDLVRYTAIALVPVLLIAANVELGRHWRLAGPGGRRALWPMLVASPIWCVTVFAGYFADVFLDEAAQYATHSFNVIGLVQALVIPLAIVFGVVQSRLARGNVADLAVELSGGVPVGGLQPVLARALRDPSFQLAFPAPTGDGLLDPAGAPIPPPDPSSRAITSVERGGEVDAVFIGDPAVVAEDPGLVEAVGSVARLALHNERLSALVRAQLDEVRESRARLVEAGDAERRRIERDLHDGAQQRLTALALRLQTARASLPAAADLLDAATTELQAAVAEVRDLARGVHPTLLHELGLAAAIDALAERAPIPVTVDVPDVRFASGTESTTYFVVAEALTNIARYAGASRATVTTTIEAGRVVTTIADDGRGGADAARGTGLRGLADRVAAAGGRFELLSPPGGGTRVRVDLPEP